MRRANGLGLGLIGGSLALALKKNGFHVSGTDENIETSKSALEREIIGAIGVDPLAEISFVATPVSSIPMQAAIALAQTKGIVSDVGGVKASVVDSVRDARFIGVQPPRYFFEVVKKSTSERQNSRREMARYPSL